MVYKYWVGGALGIIDDKSLGGKQRGRDEWYQGIATRSSRFSTDISLAERDILKTNGQWTKAGWYSSTRQDAQYQSENNEATLQFTGLVSRLPWPTPLLIRTPNCCAATTTTTTTTICGRVYVDTLAKRDTDAHERLVETSINFDKDWPK